MPDSRLNLLLAYGGWRDDTFASQLPPVLEPLGVRCVAARTACEADRVLRRDPVHIAVVDLAIPVDDSAEHAGPAGRRVLELLRRLEQPPPTVVVRPRQPSLRDHRRGLVDALEQGAFAVLDRPFPLESMLSVLRSVLQRHYGDRWPGGPAA